jgi:hypothetical protein
VSVLRSQDEYQSEQVRRNAPTVCCFDHTWQEKAQRLENAGARSGRHCSRGLADDQNRLHTVIPIVRARSRRSQIEENPRITRLFAIVAKRPAPV